MEKPKPIEIIKYDWDHNGLIWDVVKKLNQMIVAINYLLSAKK